MAKLKELWNALGRKVHGLFKTCFVTCDFSTLTSLRDPEVPAVRSLFQSIAAFKSDEESMFRDAFEYGDVHLLQAWCDFCSIRRGYPYLPGILRIENFSEQKLGPFLEARPWVQSCVVTKGAMKEIYGLLLHSLRQQVMISATRPEMDSMWRQVSITLGPVPLPPYNQDDPINRATWFAARQGITIIVAAGNEGQLLQGTSLNPWARPPWVIGVGATNADGSELLESSSRGAAGQSSAAPTVVAPGQTSSYDGVDHGVKVAIENIRKSPPGSFEMTVVGPNVYNFEKDKEGRITVSWQRSEHESTPPVPIEVFFEYLEKKRSSQVTTVAGTSYATEYVAARCVQIAKHVKPLLPALPKEIRPKLLKTILEDLARPFGKYQHFEIGKGLVTEAIVDSYLQALDGARLTKLVARASAS